MKEITRKFQDSPATREACAMLVGLVGPSGTGKTYSALRLATGIQRVSGGDIMMIDTESRRALHYADTFKFRHLPFGSPFSPLDYLAAFEHAVKQGAKTIIVDSMSHEHEGPGGVLEMHEATLDKLAGDNYGKRQALTFAAWAEPKAQRRRLINTFMQMEANFIFCFRAKQKLRIPKKGDADREVKSRGWQPIGGEEFIYEMMLKCLLLPGADGTPTWSPEEEDEKSMVKLPKQYRELFAKSPQLSEDVGQALAEWAAGTNPVAELVAKYADCKDLDALGALKEIRARVWPRATEAQQAEIKAAALAAKTRCDAAKTGHVSTCRCTDPDGVHVPECPESPESKAAVA